MIDAQNLNDISLQSIWDDEGRLGDDELTCARDAAGASADCPAVIVRCCAQCEARPLTRRTRCLAQCRPEANSSLRLSRVTTGYSCRRAFRSRSLLLAVPGPDPLFDPLMEPFAAIERSHDWNAGGLPLVHVQVLIYRLSGEERSALPGAESAVERELVLRLASVLWRLRRATGIEAALFESATEDSPQARTPAFMREPRWGRRSRGAQSTIAASGTGIRGSGGKRAQLQCEEGYRRLLLAPGRSAD